MVTVTFYTVDAIKYVGVFSGKTWMDARNEASKFSGIDVDNLLPITYTSLFPTPEDDE